MYARRAGNGGVDRSHVACAYARPGPVPPQRRGAGARQPARLRTSREESQEALAYRSGLSYARIELAQSAPGWDTVRSIARALDVTMAELGAAVDLES
jgi:DNA-binding XRE family transcriptional regulator